MLPDGVYILTENLKNTVAYVAGSRRWEHKRMWKAGRTFKVVTNVQYRTKHLSSTGEGWNIIEGPLFALIAPKLQFVEALPPNLFFRLADLPPLSTARRF